MRKRLGKYLGLALLIIIVAGASSLFIYYKYKTACLHPLFFGIISTDANQRIQIFANNELLVDQTFLLDSMASVTGDHFFYLEFYKYCPSDSTLNIRLVLNQNQDTTFTCSVPNVAGYQISSATPRFSSQGKSHFTIWEESREHKYAELSPWYELWLEWGLWRWINIKALF